MNTHSLQVGLYLCHVIACALHGTNADAIPEGFAWEELFALAQQQRVEGISFMGLPAEISKECPDLFHRWSQAADVTLYKELAYKEECNAIECSLNSVGLSTMVLKGTDICACYPRPGMRSMSDVDILYGYVERDSSHGDIFHIVGNSLRQRRTVMNRAMVAAHGVMERLGYRQHDLVGYIRQPYHVELHSWIMEPDSKLFAYYANPWGTARPIKGSTLRFRQSLEDTYIFHIAHCYKHYENNGCGVRFLIDQYVLNNRISTSGCDNKYIARELKKMGLLDFESRLRVLARFMFSDKENNKNTSIDLILLQELLDNNAFGSRRHGEATQIDKRNIAQYLKWRLWPGWGWVEGRHPFVAAHPYFVPFLLIARFFLGVFLKPRRRLREIKNLLYRKMRK
ncbi:nucleotidyltransferase family protein [Bifidobacterium scaligerum]|nr:nucleotidyltransferase family protein [Bifidobacterium scaligerum]